jgi:ribosomal protein L11 methyltransferase
MASTKLSVRTTDLGVAQAISNALEAAEPALDAVTLFEDGAGAWRIEAYTQSRADAEAAAKALRAEKGRPVANIKLEDLPDLNWVAISQAALPPVIAGRFVVHGSHDRGRIPHGPRAIVVDAGEAFGTAHHDTTLGCLLAIDKLARTGRFRRVLDLGCGSGVLSIAAVRLGHAPVFACDVDPLAVSAARENVRSNQVDVEVFQADAASDELPAAELWLANLAKGPLSDVLARPDAPRRAIVSGLFADDLPRMPGWRIAREVERAGWRALLVERA